MTQDNTMPASDAANSEQPITPAMRGQFIAVSAYYRAEKRNFESGSELDDWLRAEDQIDRLLINRFIA